VKRTTYCRHTYDDGRPCHGYAGSTGYCPPHADRNARQGGRPRKEHLDEIRAEQAAWVAACACVTGKEV